MPYVEPRFNQFDVSPPDEVTPDVHREDPKEILKLAKVWDAQNLLALIPEQFALGPDFSARIFNNFKSTTADRQIGDRRSQNFREGIVSDGPSRMLPGGVTLLQVMPRRFTEVLKVPWRIGETSTTSSKSPGREP